MGQWSVLRPSPAGRLYAPRRVQLEIVAPSSALSVVMLDATSRETERSRGFWKRFPNSAGEEDLILQLSLRL